MTPLVVILRYNMPRYCHSIPGIVALGDAWTILPFSSFIIGRKAAEHCEDGTGEAWA